MRPKGVQSVKVWASTERLQMSSRRHQVLETSSAQRARQLFTTARDVNKTTWPTLVISCVRSEQDGLLVYQSRAAQRARQLFTTARDVYEVHKFVH